MNAFLIEQFKSHFNKEPVVYSSAPGRLEILGNHTDYNEGLVLSAAVGQKTEMCLAPVPGKHCRLFDFRDQSSSEFDLDQIAEAVKGDWGNYIKGCIVALNQRGITIPAFEAGIYSTVPLAAGMSSSAALEMSFCFAIAKAFDIVLPLTEWARIGQFVENKYLGLGSGLLDQFSSIFGQQNALILCDFRTVEVLKTIPVPVGYDLVVANTMVKHNLVDSEYNVRRQSCENARNALKTQDPKIKALRDVSLDLLERQKTLMSHVDYRRAKHVVGEDERVLQAEKLLEQGDIKGFGKLLFESHQSSMENFENSCNELDILIDLAKVIPGCIGARLSGGGFGGISIHLVAHAESATYCERLKTAYTERTDKKIETIICTIGDGASSQII